MANEFSSLVSLYRTVVGPSARARHMASALLPDMAINAMAMPGVNGVTRRTIGEIIEIIVSFEDGTELVMTLADRIPLDNPVPSCYTDLAR